MEQAMQDANLNSGREESYVLDGRRLWHSSFDARVLENPQVIVDVGAYDFGDSIRLKCAFPDCTVYGIEMSRSVYQRHHRYARRRGVLTSKLAISDRCGRGGYYQSHQTDGVDAQSSLLRPGSKYLTMHGHHVHHDETPTPVRTMTLDRFCATRKIRHIDLLHVDVEGAEYLVFAGMKTVRPTWIFAEFLLDGGWQKQPSFGSICGLLGSYGYREVKRIAHDRLFTWTLKAA